MKPQEFMTIFALCEAQKNAQPVAKQEPVKQKLPDWVVCDKSYQAWLNGCGYYLGPSGISIDTRDYGHTRDNV